MGLTDEQREEVAALRAQRAETRRATVAAVEDILYEPLPVLDHGFVRVIDYMGDDAAIVQAARGGTMTLPTIPPLTRSSPYAPFPLGASRAKTETNPVTDREGA